MTDILSLVNNEGLESGVEIDMSKNYLDLTKGSDDMKNIESLIDKGVDLKNEPQKDD